MENNDSKRKVNGVNECVDGKVEKNRQKMRVKNSVMTVMCLKVPWVSLVLMSRTRGSSMGPLMQ